MKGVLYTIMAFTFLCIVSSCKENVKTGLTSTKTFEVDSIHVLYCKINPSGLKYDNLNVIEYKGKFYSPRIDACYINGELRTLDLYKSDGIISYTNKDLKRDNLLTKHLDIPLNRTIIIQTDTISDNGIASIYENRRDSMFVEKNNEIIIYYTKSGE